MRLEKLKWITPASYVCNIINPQFTLQKPVPNEKLRVAQAVTIASAVYGTQITA
jgi:hypothetical protein